MLYHLKKYDAFYVLSLIFIIIGSVSLLQFGKGDLVLWFNNHQSYFLNELFMHITMLGEFTGGVFVFTVLILFTKYKNALIFLIAVLITSLSSQGLKRGFYKDEKRPSYVYKNLNDIEDLDRHVLFSFPSGHTTAAFTFFSILAFALVKRRFQVLAFTLAAAVGVSRVYLGQHYVNDVVAGASIGLILTAILYIMANPYLAKIPWLNKQLSSK